MKLSSRYMYSCINGSSLYCDLKKATMFTRVLDRVENTSNFQQIPVTPATMEGQLFWLLEIRGDRNKNNANTTLSPDIVLIKTMACFSHSRRLTGISIHSVADVPLMVLVWKGNLRYLTSDHSRVLRVFTC